MQSQEELLTSCICHACYTLLNCAKHQQKWTCITALTKPYDHYFAINHHYCQLWRSMKLDCSHQFLAITGWGLIRNHMIFSAICCWKDIQEKLWCLKHTLYEGISDVVDTVPVMRFFRFVGIPLLCTFVKNNAPVITITLRVSFSWVEPLQSGHALLLISEHFVWRKAECRLCELQLQPSCKEKTKTVWKVERIFKCF